jgi:hypothetical protein
MYSWRSALTILACVCLLIFPERMVKQAFGVQKTTKEQPPPAVAVKAVRPSSEPPKKSSSKIVLPTGSQRPTQANQTSPRQKLPAELKPMASKRGLQVKAHRRVMPKAVVQPRTDLMHYGVLENPQRYDPLPHAHHNGVPNPQTSDLTHDHFQELDRNQDGAIDPVERTFGRIDMDRDLHTRTLQ